MDALLVTLLCLLGYAYAGYPLLAFALARVAARPHRRETIEPTVSLVIVAYNEERDIAAKLENALALDYSGDKLEIVVASDGSADRTDEIVRGFADRGVKLFRADEHPGKAGTTNRVAETLTGDILVFSDATGAYTPGALRALVRNFADPTVGAVTGRVTYRYGDSTVAEGFRAYQRLVVFARSAESEWGTETSTSGSISALRSSLFRPIPPHLDFDFCHPLHVAMAGLRTVYEADAISEEEAREHSGSEFAARVRMAMLAYSFVPYLFANLGRVRSPLYLFQILSHKLMRWLAPVLLVTLLTVSGLAAPTSTFAGLLLLAQLVFYGCAVLAYLTQARIPRPAARLLGPPLFFTTIHLAFLVGLLRTLRGRRLTTWSPDRS